MFNNIYLDEFQSKISFITDGYQIITAGPGTGKTALLIARISHLINDLKIPKEKILTLTFTNKAVEEINSRIAITRFAHTFHSFCSTILLEKNIKYKIIPKYLQNKVYTDLSTKYNMSTKDIRLNITRYKNGVEILFDKNIYLDYEKAIQKLGYWDFDDIVSKTLYLIKNEEVIQKQKLKRYKYIFVDEFQDTSKNQYELIKSLMTSSTNICVIGDPNQSIYSFRGADPEVFSLFKKDFPIYKEFFLDVNYRSGKRIVKIINNIFPDKILKSTSDHECEVYLIPTLDEFTQASWIVDYIKSRIGGISFIDASSASENIDKNASLKDFAIIYRNHIHSKEIKKELFDSGLPYQIVGEESLFFRDETKVIYKVIKALMNKEIIPEQDISELLSKITISQNFLELANSLLVKLFPYTDENNKEYLDDIKNMFMELSRNENPFNKFVEYYEYMIANDAYDGLVDKINLLTMHSAKGLEFNYVFLSFFNEDIIPSNSNSEEDRRLFYVAISRAKKGLLLTHPTKYRNKNILPSCYTKYLDSAGVSILEDSNIKKYQKKMNKKKFIKSQYKIF